MSSSFARPRIAAFFLFLLAVPALALDEPTSFTIDLPFAANAATPSWLGHPQIPTTTFATLNVPIQTPDPKASLLVTVFFQEKAGGFLRINWQGGAGAQSLSENFYEGIGMGNQRALLISPEVLQGAGTLVFQCGETELGIQRIQFQWLQNQAALTSPEIKDTLVIATADSVQPAQVLSGQAPLAESPAWRGAFVRVPVTDAPERIEQGVEFSVQLDAVPANGRLALRENGLPWGQRLVVWINQQKAGTISPAVPDLLDGGFGSDPAARVYEGWREGTMYLPVSFLKAGTNTIQFATENESEPPVENAPQTASPDLLPLAVKNVILQLGYPVPSPVPDTTNSSSSVPPIPPTLSDPGAVSASASPTNAP